MRYLINESLDPYYNLALEEFLLTKADVNEDYFMLWRNNPAIVVGKHQNTIEEINLKYVEEKKIHVVRRLSGGGAVYHDLGNLNFTFIINHYLDNRFDFKKFTEPVVRALLRMGAKAYFNHRNDLEIDGKKFSGNAQYIKNGRLLHHGTLLYNSKIDTLVKALNVSDDKIISKGIKSVKSRVTNIAEHIKGEADIFQFKSTLLEYLQEEMGPFDVLSTTKEDKVKAEEIMNNRYTKWEWNYGESPEFNKRKKKKLEYGTVEALINVFEGYIRQIRFYGDFFNTRDVEEIESLLEGQRYEEKSIREVLSKIEINKYFIGFDQHQLIEVLF